MRSIAYRARFHEGLYGRGLLESLLVLTIPLERDEWGYAPSLSPEGGGYSHSRSIIIDAFQGEAMRNSGSCN